MQYRKEILFLIANTDFIKDLDRRVDILRGGFIFRDSVLFFDLNGIFCMTKWGIAIYQFFLKPYRNPSLKPVLFLAARHFPSRCNVTARFVLCFC
jgi:hypothetical protein